MSFNVLVLQPFLSISIVLSVSLDNSFNSSFYPLPEYPRIKYCFSNLDVVENMGASNYFQLKRHLDKNCTHVYGNIVINNIFRYGNKQPDLSFLSHIQEITGSVKIRNSNLSMIPLTNLRIIRGNAKLYEHDDVETMTNSLDILWDDTWEPDVLRTIIDLRNLRSILSGNIRITKHYCKNLANVNWDELLEDPNRQLIIGQCNIKLFNCSQNCPIKDGTRYCWGPSAEQCQNFTKCQNRLCANRCFLTKDGIEECCDSQCLGGCWSSDATSCLACKGVRDGDRCVSECPQKLIFDRNTGTFIENKDFRPTFVNLCVNNCPDGLLEQQGECKVQCTLKKYERQGNKCVPCKQFCEQICSMEDVFSIKEIQDSFTALDAVKIERLANCTTFKGTIHIDKESFYKNNPIKDASQLWHLSSLRNISGSVYIDLDNVPFPLDNLSFLHNLEMIEGHYGETPFSLAVLNSKISFLGLSNLKKIGLLLQENKPIVLDNNPNLCYWDTAKFIRFFDFSRVVATHLMDNETCVKNNRVCSKDCDPQFGCWGPGSGECLACRNMKLGDMCADNCSSLPGFFEDPNKPSKICRKCHKECANNCFGPLPNQCIGGCKSAREDDKCVGQCSRTHWLNNSTKICTPCNPDCHPRNLTRDIVCTGPLSKPGPGGCNKCQAIIIDDSLQPLNCTNKTVLYNYFSENQPSTATSKFSPFTEKFTDLIVTFKRCHDLCPVCTIATAQRIFTPHWHGCMKCNGYWNNDICVKKCPEKTTYLMKDESNTSLGTCWPCDPQCNKCNGSGNTNCLACNNFRLNDENSGTKFLCVSQCPLQYKEVQFDKRLNQTVCYYVFLNKVESLMVAMAVLFTIILLIFAVTIMKFCNAKNEKRRKNKLKAYFSNANEKDCQQFVPCKVNNLKLINIDTLEYNKEHKLGEGTFGAVYYGYWKPEESDIEDNASLNSCINRKHEVAVKVLKESCNQNTFLEEVKIMASVRHRHCLRLIGVCYNGDKKLLISSYLQFGSMDKYLVNNKMHLTGETLLTWAEQIANGMLYLERNHIIHRDLATRNVLIYTDKHVQITDFGLAKFMTADKDQIKVVGGMVPVRWLAIETLQNSIYSHKTDVWAYGVTLWEIFTFAKVPYENVRAENVRDEIIKGTRLCQPEICSLDIYILMLKCWSTDQDDRPSFEYLWNEFKMYSSSPQTYLSHPNNETKSSYPPVNYTDILGDVQSFSRMNSYETDFLPSFRGSPMSASPLLDGRDICKTLGVIPTRNDIYQSADYHVVPMFNPRHLNTALKGTSFNNHLRHPISRHTVQPDYLEPRHPLLRKSNSEL